MKLLLSICMMVKDEENNLDRCLSSLKPLLNETFTELIVVDTGSTDNTVEIAKKYTDRVYYHEWNNDFSEMRNKTISYAKGSWIMIVDADEEVENAENIISFIKGKIRNDIGAGALTLRNVKGNDKNRLVATVPTARLFRNTGTFRYEGIVHNIPFIEGNVVELDATVVHYGYNSEDYELMEKKFLRTSNLLILALEKNPDNYYYRFQLSVTYHMHKDFQKALFEIINAYEVMKAKSKKIKKDAYIYPQLSKCYLLNGYYNEAIEYAKEGLTHTPDNFDLYFYMAQAHLLLENHEEGIRDYEKYLDLVNNYASLEIRLNLIIQTMTNTLDCMVEAYYNMAVTSFKLESFDRAAQYAHEVINISKNSAVSQKALVIAIESYFIQKEYVKITDLMKMNYPAINNELIHLVEKYVDINDEICLHSLVDLPEPLGSLMQLRLLRKLSDIDSEYKSYLEHIRSNRFDIIQNEYFYFMIRFAIPIEGFLANQSEARIMETISYANEKYSDFESWVDWYLKHHGFDLGYEGLNAHRILLKYKAIVSIHQKQHDDILKAYCMTTIEWLESKYSYEYLERATEYPYLSEEESLFIKLRYLLIHNDTAKIEEQLQLLLNRTEVFAFLLERLVYWYSPNYNGGEMDLLENDLVSQLEVLIKAGECSQATHLMIQASEILPNSFKLYGLRKKIDKRVGA